MLHADTFRDLLTEAAQCFGDQPFLIDDPHLGMVSYRDLLRFSLGMERYLTDLGIPQGAAVVTLLHNSGIAALLFLSVIFSRRLLVPVNPISTAPELDYMLKRCGCAAVIVDPSNTLADNYTGAHPVITVNNHRKFFSVLHQSGTAARVSSIESTVAAFVGEVVFTSGSTGRPKGVLLSEQNLLSNARSLATVYKLNSSDRFLTVCPLFHNSGQVFTTLSCALVGGSTAAVNSAAGMLRFWSYIERYRATWSFGMLSFLSLLLSRSEVPTDSSFIRAILTGGSAVDTSLIQRFESRFKIPVRTVYGLTETSSISTCEYLDPSPRSLGSSGRPLPTCTLKIEVAPGVSEAADAPCRGEILISGPHVFDSYIGDPDLTQQRKLGNWLRTGDLGYFDSSGNLFVIDRLDSMLIVGGENVYPAEVEKLCTLLPGAAQIVMVGVDHPIWGKELVLVYKPVPDAEPQIQQWRDVLETHIAAIKIPRKFIPLRDLGCMEFPRKENGKLDRNAVTALVASLKFRQPLATA